MDYPVAPPDRVEPTFYRTQIIDSMMLKYKYAANLSDEDAMAAALATWNTEWGTDPSPRTIKFGIDEVNGDLEYWGEPE